ncbi:MAG: helix-turn-helix domain-containing protein [Clostridiales bacterium]|nr:helix-turn-helix domain-containing protein [Clostridiales bacterium]
MRINANANSAAILIELGQRIKHNRIAMNITQAELAERSGVSPSTEIRIENGEDSKMSNYICILRALNMLENIDALIPEVQPDFKFLYENRPLRKRANPGRKKAGASWTWGEDK